MFFVRSFRSWTSRLCVAIIVFAFLGIAGTTTSPPAYAAACGTGTAPSGSGGLGDPWRIGTPAELIWVSWATSSGNSGANPTRAEALSGYYEQTADIDLGGCEWTQIGAADDFTELNTSPFPYPFEGTYDGRGFSISGLVITGLSTVSANYAVGLFGIVEDATLTRVSVVDARVEGISEVAVLAGTVNGESTISYSRVSGQVTSGTSSFHGRFVGGLVGKLDGSGAAIENSYSFASVNGYSNNPNQAGVGGLVGDANQGDILRSYAAGLVVNRAPLRVDTDSVGGLVGSSSSSGVVADSFWDVDVSQQTLSWGTIPQLAPTDPGYFGKATAAMQTLATYSDPDSSEGLTTAWNIVDGWEPFDPDSGNVWGLCSGLTEAGGYPYLLWEYTRDEAVAAGCSVPALPSVPSSEQRASAPAIHLDLQAEVGDAISGAPVVIGGQGLAGGSNFTLIVRSDPQVVDSGTASPLGNFSKRVFMPALSPGSHTLTLTATAPDGSSLSLVQPFSVGANGLVTSLSPTTGSTTAALAATGPEGTTVFGVAGVAAVLALAGVLMVASARRRNRVAH